MSFDGNSPLDTFAAVIARNPAELRENFLPRCPRLVLICSSVSDQDAISSNLQAEGPPAFPCRCPPNRVGAVSQWSCSTPLPTLVWNWLGTHPGTRLHDPWQPERPRTDTRGCICVHRALIDSSTQQVFPQTRFKGGDPPLSARRCTHAEIMSIATRASFAWSAVVIQRRHRCSPSPPFVSAFLDADDGKSESGAPEIYAEAMHGPLPCSGWP